MSEAADNNIAILGLGGGGGRIVAKVAAGNLPKSVRIAAADTDLQALGQLPDVIPLPLGEEWANRESCGGDIVLGERAVSASAGALREFLEGARLLICVTAMGGGTGSGGARVVGRLARELKLPSVFLATLPFSFEGQWRRSLAEKGLDPVRKLSQAVIEVPNDLLFTTMSADTPAVTAFGLADELLAQGVVGLAQLAFAKGVVAADFAALRTLLRDRQATSTLGFGRGEGANRWQNALESLAKCPLIGGHAALANAHAAVVTILGGEDLTVREIQACLNGFQAILRPDAKLVVGAYTQPGLQEFHITALLCQYRDEQPQSHASLQARPAPNAPRKRRGASAAVSKDIQGELPLQEHSLGIFSGSQSTTVDGQNLDVPTFQRRGIVLDVGD